MQAARWRCWPPLAWPPSFGGNDTLVYEGLETNDSRENPLAVVGGTGKYAGADGTATVRELSFNEKTLAAYERITVTFTR